MARLTIGFLALAITACNSNSQPTPGGNICASGYNPISQNPVAGQKPVPTDPTENKSAPADAQMKPGTYTYAIADVVYVEKAQNLPLKMQFHDEAAAGVSTRQSIFCSENAKPGMNIPATEVSAPTDVIVCNDFHQIVRSRKFSWNVTNTRINFGAPTPELANWCNDSAQKITGKDQAIFLKDVDNTYEFRMSRDTGAGKYDLAIRMVYAQFANGVEPADCRQCTPPATQPVTPKANPQPFQKKDGDNQQIPRDMRR